MTSGLDREPGGPHDFTVGPVSEWEKVLVAALPHVKYVSEPDTRYLYSNVSYAVLGAALGRAARQSYVDYLSQHILAPLGMTHTIFEPDAEMRARGRTQSSAGGRWPRTCPAPTRRCWT